jgi:hypothetical protein
MLEQLRAWQSASVSTKRENLFKVQGRVVQFWDRGRLWGWSYILIENFPVVIGSRSMVNVE